MCRASVVASQDAEAREQRCLTWIKDAFLLPADASA